VTTSSASSRMAAAGGSAPLTTLDAGSRARLAAIAGRLIPDAHGMPSAAEVLTDDRVRFVLQARPDLIEPLRGALRVELGDDVQARLDALGHDDPAILGALHLVIVAGYYTDRRVRELIGYPGQLAIEVKSGEHPSYLEEGLIDAVLARGPVWRDPATGRRAEVAGTPRTYKQRVWSTTAGSTQGGNDGGDGT